MSNRIGVGISTSQQMNKRKLKVEIDSPLFDPNSDHHKSPRNKKKIAPRSALQFKIGPSFGSTNHKYKIFSSNSNLPLVPIIHARIDRGFELANKQWIGYKRNYFTLVASFEFEQQTLEQFITDNYFIISGLQEKIDINYFALRLSSRCSEDGTPINLVQHTAKRDRGPQFPPPVYAAVPGILPDHCTVKEAANVRNGSKIDRINKVFYLDKLEYCSRMAPRKTFLDNYPMDNISRVARYERIQFSSSITYRKPTSSNKHFKLKMELIGILANGKQVSISESETPPLVIRGRSPSNYQASMKNSKASKKPKGSPEYIDYASLDRNENSEDSTISDPEHADSSSQLELKIHKEIRNFNNLMASKERNEADMNFFSKFSGSLNNCENTDMDFDNFQASTTPEIMDALPVGFYQLNNSSCGELKIEASLQHITGIALSDSYTFVSEKVRPPSWQNFQQLYPTESIKLSDCDLNYNKENICLLSPFSLTSNKKREKVQSGILYPRKNKRNRTVMSERLDPNWTPNKLHSRSNSILEYGRRSKETERPSVEDDPLLYMKFEASEHGRNKEVLLEPNEYDHNIPLEFLDPGLYDLQQQSIPKDGFEDREFEQNFGYSNNTNQLTLTAEERKENIANEKVFTDLLDEVIRSDPSGGFFEGDDADFSEMAGFY